MHYDESFEKNIFSRHNLFAIKKLNINIDIKDRDQKFFLYYQKTTEYFYVSPKNDIKEECIGYICHASTEFVLNHAFYHDASI